MEFELTMRLLLGSKAFHIEDAALVPKYRREWLRKAARKLLWAANSLDTAPHHKELLFTDLEKIRESTKRIDEPTWSLVYALIRLSARLLGFEYATGAQLNTPVYYRTWSQYYTAHSYRGGNVGDAYVDEQNAIAIRRQVAARLSETGLDDFKISLVLNTTEYEVKQLRSTRKRATQHEPPGPSAEKMTPQEEP